MSVEREDFSDYFDDEELELQDKAVSDLIEWGIRDQRDGQIAHFLGSYGDAVQERVDRCISQARKLAVAGFPGPAVLSAVTAAELTIRYFILRPILEGAFLSEAWAGILLGRILCPRAVTDRELLPAVLRTWNIDLTALRLASGKPLWSSFVKEVLPLRNDISHKGVQATAEQAAEALEFAEAFLEQVVKRIVPRNYPLAFSPAPERIRE